MTEDDKFVISGKCYTSRLLIGTGKYNSLEQMQSALDNSGAEIVTVAIRRAITKDAKRSNLLDCLLSRKNITILPNSSGCFNSDEAVRILSLARELFNGFDLVKLEVLGSSHSLFPNMHETIEAAKILVKDGFKIMVYCSDDPIQCQMLQDIGVVSIMPLASLIGSGMGILNPWNLRLIIDQSRIPVIVDAGIGGISDAAIAMELGCDGILVNTAIAGAKNPILMAKAMREAVKAGRSGFLAGRMPKKEYIAEPSSPQDGISAKF